MQAIAKVSIKQVMLQKINLNYILAANVALLLFLCFMSVWRPIHFNNVRTERETEVKEHIEVIKKAEEVYLNTHGSYTNDFKALIKGGYIKEQDQYVPYSDGERFELQLSVKVDKQGRKRDAIVCGAKYEQYLNGLNKASIDQLTSQAEEMGQYPGIR